MSTFQSNNFSGSTFSGRTYYSGGTNLETIITNLAGNGGQTYVQPGTNITTGGTASAPIVSVVASPVFTTLSSTTLNAGTVNADDAVLGNSLNTGTIEASFLNTNGAGFAITTGGIASSIFTGGTVSGGTYYSGSTPLSTIISNIASSASGAVLALSAGTNITTGGTQQNPTVNVTPNPTFSTLIATSTINSNLIQAGSLITTPLLTATTVSGGTYFSGNTALGTIITNQITAAYQTGLTQATQGGLFTYTGGTAAAPTINLAQNISGATVSAGTLFSGSTRIEDTPIFVKTNFAQQTQTLTAGAGLRLPLTGTTINIPSTGLRVGTRFKYSLHMSKTAAGTATNVLGFHLGTNSGNAVTGNTMLSSLSAVTQTAVVDDAYITADIFIRGPLGASCVAQTTWTLIHNGSTAGFANRQCVVSAITTSTFNSSTANLVSCLCLSGGASSVITIPYQFVEVYNL